MRQTFNVREGINLLNFTLADRVLRIPPLKSGPTAGFTVDIDTLVREHLEEMDWDQVTAVPSQDKLDALGLGDNAQDLLEKGHY